MLALQLSIWSAYKEKFGGRRGQGRAEPVRSHQGAGQLAKKPAAAGAGSLLKTTLTVAHALTSCHLGIYNNTLLM